MSIDRSIAPSHALSSPADRFGARLRTNVSAENLQADVMAAEANSLAHTFAQLAASASVPAASQILLGARRRYFSGAGKSSAYANLLTHDLSSTLANVFLVDGHALSSLTVLSDVRATDALVLFSVRRYREETVKFGTEFARAGGSVVLVTDSADSPLAGIAAVVITVDTGSVSYADSPTAIAAVCHLLSTLTAASAKGARRRLAAREEIAIRLGLYHHDESASPDPQEP
ncbi:MurR/RpiR family transcriptional regulator [Rarobacter incanus]|uniref:DNA-binding MurR/RpiR family transcriptional regulator n=1 Tax=Rarobacter incanus TaxID=153494 RepID=A0A542SNF0_9MICO|nr:SIS domain-containing protein [Rarobacter incanus]TQK76151.1 DNA-binding MurR/RpiR family transcriptional regulator [Rarobacter incanus]